MKLPGLERRGGTRDFQHFGVVVGRGELEVAEKRARVERGATFPPNPRRDELKSDGTLPTGGGQTRRQGRPDCTTTGGTILRAAAVVEVGLAVIGLPGRAGCTTTGGTAVRAGIATRGFGRGGVGVCSIFLPRSVRSGGRCLRESVAGIGTSGALAFLPVAVEGSSERVEVGLRVPEFTVQVRGVRPETAELATRDAP